MWQLWIVSVVIWPLLFAVSSSAMMIEIPLEELAREADLIIVGKVESVQGQKRDEMIFSLAQVSVKEVIKGTVAPGARLTVEFEGGTVGGETLEMEDSPDYKQGEEFVAFLETIPDTDVYETVGLLQGKRLIKEGKVLPENIPLETFLEQIESFLHK